MVGGEEICVCVVAMCDVCYSSNAYEDAPFSLCTHTHTPTHTYSHLHTPTHTTHTQALLAHAEYLQEQLDAYKGEFSWFLRCQGTGGHVGDTEGTCRGHRGTCRGHRGTCRGHRGTCRGHRGTCRGHRGTCRGHRGGQEHGSQENTECMGYNVGLGRRGGGASQKGFLLCVPHINVVQTLCRVAKFHLSL